MGYQCLHPRHRRPLASRGPGRRPVRTPTGIPLGLGLFTGFSLLGGLAQNGAWLVTARTFQGASGAVLAPATLSLLTTTFSDPTARRRALGAWSATAASGAAIGVLASGVLTDLLDWRWVLIVNVPIGVVLLAAAAWALPRTPRDGAVHRLDVARSGCPWRLMSALIASTFASMVPSPAAPGGARQALTLLVPGGPARIVGTYSSSWMRPSKVRLLIMSSATSG